MVYSVEDRILIEDLYKFITIIVISGYAREGRILVLACCNNLFTFLNFNI